MVVYGLRGPLGRRVLQRRRARIAVWCLFLAAMALPFVYRILAR
jgi:hypothetical protein